MRIRKIFIIEYEAPYPESEEDSVNWLCKENLQSVLEEGVEGGIPYKVKQLKPKDLRRRIRFIGDIAYIMGGNTMIKIIEDPDKSKPLCEIIEIGKFSKFEIGDIINLPSRFLYPFKGKVVNKKRLFEKYK